MTIDSYRAEIERLREVMLDVAGELSALEHLDNRAIYLVGTIAARLRAAAKEPTP